ncbi:MAG: ATP synthase F0 subunit B [Treponema sp.]|jgi:F-type H+-transporting ATPase subunit b|nr:ATP synthase F0 subunit B [Treponema sp.]
MLDFSVTFLITVINITILFFILKALLFKPVTKFMADRAQRVQDSIDQAQRDKDEAKVLLDKYEDKLKSAEAQALEILKKAREDAGREAQLIIAEGKRSAQDAVNSALKQIETEHQTVLAKFKIEAATLVIAVGAKLAERDFSGDDNRRYVNMLLEELSAQASAQKGSG